MCPYSVIIVKMHPVPWPVLKMPSPGIRRQASSSSTLKNATAVMLWRASPELKNRIRLRARWAARRETMSRDIWALRPRGNTRKPYSSSRKQAPSQLSAGGSVRTPVSRIAIETKSMILLEFAPLNGSWPIRIVLVGSLTSPKSKQRETKESQLSGQVQPA